MSTWWDVHNISGIQRCMRGDIMIHVGECHEYIGACSVHRGCQYKLKAFIN